MLIRGTCARSEFYTTLVNAINTSGLWTNVSSNQTEDFNMTNTYWAGSDGNVYKSNFAKNGQNVYFAMKQAHNWATYSADGMNIRIQLLGGYTPGASGNNGVMSNYYANCFCWSITNMGTKLTQSVEYVITIEAHRIIIVVHPAGDVTKNSNVLYVGFLDQNTVVDGISYHNAYLIPSVCSYYPQNIGATTSTTVIILKSPFKWGDTVSTSYVSPTMLPYIINPNYNGVYTVATIDIKYTVSNANLGFIGSLDGIYALPAGNIVHLDTLTINSDNYLVVRAGSGLNSFGCIWMAIKLT